MMLTRADVERITENILSELRIEVTGVSFEDPNRRKIRLLFRDRVIDTDFFDVIQSTNHRE